LGAPSTAKILNRRLSDRSRGGTPTFTQPRFPPDTRTPGVQQRLPAAAPTERSTVLHEGKSHPDDLSVREPCTRAWYGVLSKPELCQALTALHAQPNAERAPAVGPHANAKELAVEGVASFMAGQVPAQRRWRAEREFQPCRRLGGKGGGNIARLSKRCTWLQPSSSSAPALRNAGRRQYRAALWLRTTKESRKSPCARTSHRVEATPTYHALASIQAGPGTAAGTSESPAAIFQQLRARAMGS
jgi:hypothetical protein